MKKIKYIFLILILGFIGFNINSITEKISALLKNEPKVIISKPNEYYRDLNFNYVKQSKDFIPYSKQDLYDIFYSILNNGYETFTFYCPEEYTDCLTEIEKMTKNSQETLTNINNFVSVFNSFSNIKIVYSTSGEVNVEIKKLYTEEEINKINEKINSIEKELYNDNMKTEDKILAVHDYIINHTKYDDSKKDDKNNNNKYLSNKAYGPLIQGYAVCGGYADAMELFLNKLNVPNFKISSDTHIWNAVYIDNKWLHLDLTWDDPITLNSDEDTLTHKFYLINTKSLEEYKISDHDFDKTIYQELK